MQTEVAKTSIIVTGLPGLGKTTLIRNVLHEVRALNPTGCYTEEVREKGVRKGFFADRNGGPINIQAASGRVGL